MPSQAITIFIAEQTAQGTNTPTSSSNKTSVFIYSAFLFTHSQSMADRPDASEKPVQILMANYLFELAKDKRTNLILANLATEQNLRQRTFYCVSLIPQKEKKMACSTSRLCQHVVRFRGHHTLELRNKRYSTDWWTTSADFCIRKI